MIECDLFPGCFIMTGHAVGWECIGNVVGIRNVAVIVFVTSETVPGKTGPLIVCMTIAAKDKSVRPAKFETGKLNMVKLSTLPLILIVANVAVGGKSKGAMCRRDCLLVFS